MVKNKKENAGKKVNHKYVLSEYWRFAGIHKWKLLFVILVTVIYQALGLVDKFIFKVVVDKGTAYSSGVLGVDLFIKGLLILLGIYVMLSIVQMIFDWIQIHLGGQITSGTVQSLKKYYFNHILDLDHDFHATHKTGSLISRLNRCSGAIESFNSNIMWDVAPFIVQIIILSATFAYFSPIQALALLAFSFVYLANTFIVTKRFEKYRTAFNKASDTEKGNLADIFTNIDSVRHFGKNKNIKNIFAKFVDRTYDKDLEAWHYWRWADIPGKIIVMVGFILLLILPIKEFIAGDITLGTVTFVYTAYLGYLGTIRHFSHSIRNLSRSLTDMGDLFEYGKKKNKIKDKKNARDLKIKKGKIEFRNISFQYNKNRGIFNKFSLAIPANKTVALVGHSGCGKSSLVKLLYRLYDVNSGEIRIDGQNIRDIKQESLRSGMSIVPQECILFDDTIYNNIQFADPDSTKEQVFEAIKFAQLDEIISRLPKKENTIVGERGVKLSGGEKQRVSIARAILADKKILVLDEATSALDSETEWQIQQDLEKLMKGRTSIIIAHRLSTIMKADIIVVMKDGKIEQKGTHRELITEGGEYARLWEFQKGGYVE